MENSDWDFWINHAPMLEEREEQIERIPKRYYFVYNTYTNVVEYASNSFSEITGYPEIKTMLDMLTYLHPDDVQYCMNCERKLILFLNQLHFEDNFRFSTEYTFRVKTNYGHYIFIRQKYQALEVDSKGFMSMSIVFHEVLPDDFVRSEDDFIIYDRLKNRPVLSENIYNLTKREWQILDLIIEGLNSKEISIRINLSEHTIRTHRKNILSKTHSTSFLELTKKLKRID